MSSSAVKPNADVTQVLAGYPAPARRKLLAVRKLIFKVAAQTPGVGVLQETLKWGQVAYLTNKTKAGTTLRLGWSAKTPERYCIYVHCGTTLVSTYRALYPELTFEGNRAIVLGVQDDTPTSALEHCITMALTYHLAKRTKAVI